MATERSNLMLSMKLLLISIGAVSSAILIKSSVPLHLYELSMIWTTVISSWLKPPYLYVIINGIIIIIVATSRSHRKEHSTEDQSQAQPLISTSFRAPPPSDFTAISQPNVYSVQDLPVVAFQSEPKVYEFTPEPVIEPEVFEIKPMVLNGSVESVNGDENDEFLISNSVLKALPEAEIELLQQLATEKPLVSTRFSHRRPAMKMANEGMKALKVARTKRHETLESTWKKITEGRHVPLTRHLKPDTWQNHEHHMTRELSLEENKNTPPLPPQPQQNHHQQRRVKIQKESSPSQDELNRRVEAFIKKFNEEMRLQRQQSLQQYMEMINRGV